MAFFKKRPPEEHTWLSDEDPVESERFQAVPLSRSLDAGYFAILDGDFAEIHPWPPDLFRFVKRSIGANDRIRSLYTRHVAAVVPTDEPNKVIGLIAVEKAHPDIPGTHYIHLHVLPDQRRTGIMSELLPKLFARLKRADFEDVVIPSNKDNAAMNGLAKKLSLNHKNVEHEYPDGESEKTRYYRVIK